jgi:hypothetical protein
MTATRVHRKAIVIPITEGRRPPRPSPVSADAAPVRHTLGRRGIELRVNRSGFEGILFPLIATAAPFPEILCGDAHRMNYAVCEDNKIRVCPAGLGRPKDAVLVFADRAELARQTAGWPRRRFVEVWNQLPGTRAVRRFENQTVAVERIWRVVESIRDQLERIESRPPRKAAARETKTELIVRMLRDRNGATIVALSKATGWQAHSVRAFLSAKVGRQLGLNVQSVLRDGERVYRIARGSSGNS